MCYRKKIPLPTNRTQMERGVNAPISMDLKWSGVIFEVMRCQYALRTLLNHQWDDLEWIKLLFLDPLTSILSWYMTIWALKIAYIFTELLPIYRQILNFLPRRNFLLNPLPNTALVDMLPGLQPPPHSSACKPEENVNIWSPTKVRETNFYQRAALRARWSGGPISPLLHLGCRCM